MITMKMIAEIAGVSIGTVDRALHNRPGVNAEVAKKICHIAASLNYEPNFVAKALSTKKRPVNIGVIFHVRPNPFHENVLKGIEEAYTEVRHYGISITVRHGEDFSVENQLELIDELVYKEKVDALVLIPLNDDRIRKKINKLHEKNFPIIFIVSDLADTKRLAYVGCDAMQIGRIAAGLVSKVSSAQGQVLYITSPLNMLGNLQRYEGFKQNISMRYPRLSILGPFELDNNEIIAYKQAVEIFQTHTQIDAIVVTTGSLTGFFQALGESQCCGQIPIIALDLAKPVQEGLKEELVTATIVQHPTSQGYQAIKLLADYFIRQEIPDQEKCFVNCEIKIVESLF
jgi:LacI family transcriptional regulator